MGRIFKKETADIIFDKTAAENKAKTTNHPTLNLTEVLPTVALTSAAAGGQNGISPSLAFPVAAAGAVVGKNMLDGADSAKEAADVLFDKGKEVLSEGDRIRQYEGEAVAAYLASDEADRSLEGWALIDAAKDWYAAKQTRQGHAEKKDDVDTFTEREPLRDDDTSHGFAKRVCDTQFGPGNYKTGPGSAYSRAQKYAEQKLKARREKSGRK